MGLFFLRTKSMALKLITAPSTYPVTLAEAKLHCRVDIADDDTLITAFITAATEMAEQKTGRAIMTQTLELTLDAFPEAFELTRVPVQSITSVKYYDTTGTQQTLSNTLYALDAAEDFGFAHISPVYAGVWPDTRDQINAVAVRYVAGYADAASVPQSIKNWILLMVSTMYSNRETEAYSSRAVSTTVQMQFVDRLLDRYVVFSQ
jgi:uncharacterized phiE125 gp8 family phage protein